jgi:carbonic anhydrase
MHATAPAPAPAADPHVAAPKAAAPTPDEALRRLFEGNARFAEGTTQRPNQDQARRCLTFADGQHPYATILSCADSRVPPELLFDAGIGDLFVIRVAGNVADTDEIATIEYGVGHLGTPLVLVLGHNKCGAVTAVAQGAELHGNLPGLLDNITVPVRTLQQTHPSLSGTALVNAAVKANVYQAMQDLLLRSPDVAARVASGQVKLLGAVYDLHGGTIDLLGPHPEQTGLVAESMRNPSAPAAASHAPAKPASPTHGPADPHASPAHPDPHAAPAAHASPDAHGNAADPHTPSDPAHPPATPAPAPLAQRHGLIVPAVFAAGVAALASVVVIRFRTPR